MKKQVSVFGLHARAALEPAAAGGIGATCC